MRQISMYPFQGKPEMRNRLAAFVIALSFLAVSSTANALDYESWVPLLPESIDGMKKEGAPQGLNTEKGGQAWSVLRQEYSGAEGGGARLSIVAGSQAPGITEFRKLQQLNMETKDKIVRSTNISGYKAVINLDKKGGMSHLFIAVKDNTVVIIDTAIVNNEEGLTSLADDIPLSEIKESTN